MSVTVAVPAQRSRGGTSALAEVIKRTPGKPCDNSDPEQWWFVEADTTSPDRMPAARERAEAACHGCPVKAECLALALGSGPQWGVWGGTISADRRAMLAELHAEPTDQAA